MPKEIQNRKKHFQWNLSRATIEDPDGTFIYKPEPSSKNSKF